MDTVTEPAPRTAPSAREVHTIGAICMWFLISVSPILGDVLLFPIGLLLSPSQRDRMQASYLSFHALLWEPFWNRLGYDYYRGIISCESNETSTVAALICLLFGAGIGVVGGLFQAWAMRQAIGSVRRKTVIALMILWGLILAVLSLCGLSLSWITSGGYCQDTNSFVNFSYLYICVAPFVALLLFGTWMNAQLWEKEAYG